jgi:hypothetical protein
MKLAKMGASAGISYLAANPLPFMASAVANLKTDSEGNQESHGGDKSNSNGKDQLDLFEYLGNAEETVHNVRSFRSDFQKLIDKTKLKSLVILIDDLDRCSPERLIDNLEAVKLFLNVKQTAFVVATDRRIVENAIRIRYSKMLSDDKGIQAVESLVTDYLEKLIQIPYTLPKLAPHEVRSYLCMLFMKKYLESKDFEKVLGEYTNFLEKERYASFVVGETLDTIESVEIRQNISESLRLVEACSDAITEGLKGNPRQIKRFLNAFWLRKQLAEVSNIHHLKDHVLIKLMVLEYISTERFDDVYQWHRASGDGTAVLLETLEGSPAGASTPEELPNWSTPRIRRWLKASPSLASEDLRDYFWVARSALTDTLSGVRLMSVSMKACAEQLLASHDSERKSGITLFASLSEDEQDGVLGVVAQQAMRNSSDTTGLKSLLNLAENGHLNAATSLQRCVDRIGIDTLPPGFGVPLRNFKGDEASASAKAINKLIEEIKSTDTKLGRTLNKSRTKR